MSEPENGNRDWPDGQARGPDPAGGDPMSDADWAARAASAGGEAEPDDPDAEEDLNSGMPSQLAGVPMAELIAEAREVSAAEARARALARGGALDTAVPCGTLALFLEDAAGADGLYRNASDDEVVGAVAAWDRMVSYVHGRRYQAVAALIRHRPAPGREARGPGGLPGVWGEFTGTEVAHTLADSRSGGEVLVETAYDLAGKLTATMGVLLAGRVSEDKARLIQRALVHLDEAEAAAVQDLVLDRAGRLTPGGLRAAVTRAVMQVAPDKARVRREAAARMRRVELRAEESGNAQLAVRELDADVALAIDAELSERARELKQAGIGLDTGDRRVLAFLERFGLAGDLPSSPRTSAPVGAQARAGIHPQVGPQAGAQARAGVGVTVPGRLNLTVPLATLAGEADRPGELSGFGPADPWQARRLGHAALGNPGTRVCVTVTDGHGVMTGHGCARPPTRAEREVLRGQARVRPPGSGGQGPVLTPFPGQDQRQLASGHGTWILYPGPGREPVIVKLWPVSTSPCDHRLYTPAHDPGKELRHLTRLRYGTCTGPACRRPARQCDFEHNTPWEHGGPTCLCNGNPKCRFEHRLKQHPGWRVTQHPDGRIDWTAPTGRTATTEPHRFPI